MDCESLSCMVDAGLAGYVEYPTQELVSGLLPLTDMAGLSTLSTSCIKPGQGLPGFNSTTPVRDSMVSYVSCNDAFTHWQPDMIHLLAYN